MQPFLNVLQTENLTKVFQWYTQKCSKLFFFFFLLQSYKHKHVIIDSIQRIRPFTFALGSSVSDLSSLTALTFFSLCCQLSVVSLSLGFRYWKKKKRSDQVLPQHDYCFTCIHSQINSRSSIKQRIVWARDRAFVQRPDGKGWKHVQETPPGTEEQTWRAIAKQSLVPSLHTMEKVIVENNEDICDNKIHICFEHE